MFHVSPADLGWDIMGFNNALVPPTPFLGGGAARGVRLDLPPGSVLMRKEWTHGRTGTAAQRPV